MSTRTATLERAFSPRIELPNSYTLKSGQLEWFQCDVNSRGSKNEMIKLVRASDNGVLLQIPTQSSNPNDPPYHTFELRADNVGSMPILKHCSNSIVNRISGFTGIQSRYKKGLLICIKNPNDTWSSIVLCQREDKLNSDTDPEKWRDTIVNELFTTKSYKSDFQLMCGADKFTVHCTDKYVSLVPEHRAFRKREQLVDHCLIIKDNIWSRQNFHRAWAQQGLSSFSIKNRSGREATYTIISNGNIDFTMFHLREYAEEPQDLIAREPIELSQPSRTHQHRPLPAAPNLPPRFHHNSTLNGDRTGIDIPSFALPPGDLYRPVSVPERPGTASIKKPLPKSTGSIYSTFVPQIPRETKINQIKKRERITSTPYSKRLIQIIQPITEGRTGIFGNVEENRKKTFSDIVDQKFETTYDYHGFNHVRPVDNAIIARSTSIDMTLYKIMNEIPCRGHLKTMESCDIGLGISRIPFVIRLSMSDWGTFAYQVFGDLLTVPDHDLLEEFASHMGIPAVEILLIHWKRLSGLNDVSLRVPKPCVTVIRDILTGIDRLDILDIIKNCQPNLYGQEMHNYPTL